MAPMGWADRRLPPAPEALTWERVHGALNELDAGLGFVRSIPLDVALLGAMATYVE